MGNLYILAYSSTSALRIHGLLRKDGKFENKCSDLFPEPLLISLLVLSYNLDYFRDTRSLTSEISKMVARNLDVIKLVIKVNCDKK